MDFNFEVQQFNESSEINEDETMDSKQTYVSKVLKSIKARANKRRELKIDIDNISFIDQTLEDTNTDRTKFETKPPKIERGEDLKQKLESIFNQLNSYEQEDELSQLALAFSR